MNKKLSLRARLDDEILASYGIHHNWWTSRTRPCLKFFVSLFPPLFVCNSARGTTWRNQLGELHTLKTKPESKLFQVEDSTHLQISFFLKHNNHKPMQFQTIQEWQKRYTWLTWLQNTLKNKRINKSKFKIERKRLHEWQRNHSYPIKQIVRHNKIAKNNQCGISH